MYLYKLAVDPCITAISKGNRIIEVLWVGSAPESSNILAHSMLSAVNPSVQSSMKAQVDNGVSVILQNRA